MLALRVVVVVVIVALFGTASCADVPATPAFLIEPGMCSSALLHLFAYPRPRRYLRHYRYRLHHRYRYYRYRR